MRSSGYTHKKYGILTSDATVKIAMIWLHSADFTPLLKLRCYSYHFLCSFELLFVSIRYSGKFAKTYSRVGRFRSTRIVGADFFLLRSDSASYSTSILTISRGNCRLKSINIFFPVNHQDFEKLLVLSNFA